MTRQITEDGRLAFGGVTEDGMIFAYPVTEVGTLVYPSAAIPYITPRVAYVLELHDSDTEDLVGVLENAYVISLQELLNSPALLSFELPADDVKSSDITRANELWIRNYADGTVKERFRLCIKADKR